jgi:hypothetical protein
MHFDRVSGEGRDRHKSERKLFVPDANSPRPSPACSGAWKKNSAKHARTNPDLKLRLGNRFDQLRLGECRISMKLKGGRNVVVALI